MIQVEGNKEVSRTRIFSSAQLSSGVGHLLFAASFRKLTLLAIIPMLVTGGCVGGGRQFLTWRPDLVGARKDISEEGGAFVVTVKRRFANETEQRLLALVEATYPLYPHSILIQEFRRPRAGEEPRWWLSTVDGIRVPSVITYGSVEYLLGLIRAFRAGDFSESKGIKQERARLKYFAEIEPAEAALESVGERVSLNDLFVVHLSLSWSSDCGARCGMHFERTRTAVVHRHGRVVEVLEDPLPPVNLD